MGIDEEVKVLNALAFITLFCNRNDGLMLVSYEKHHNGILIAEKVKSIVLKT